MLIIFLNNPCKQCWYSSEAYSQSIQTSKIGILAKVVNGWKPFAIFTKGYLLDVWVDSECASIVNNDNENQWFNLLFFQKNMRDSTQYSKACVQFSCFEYESSFTNPLLLYQKETPLQMLPFEIFEIFKNTFFTENPRWLLL